MRAAGQADVALMCNTVLVAGPVEVVPSRALYLATRDDRVPLLASAFLPQHPQLAVMHCGESK